MLINLNFPDIPAASGMHKLSRSIDSRLDTLLFKDVRLPELPPRDITTILDLAEAGLDSEISVLEWISLLNGKELWDNRHVNKEHSSNKLIWQVACRNHGLRYLLFWRLALHLDGQDVSFPRGLIRQFQHFQRNLLEVDKLRTSMLVGMYSGDTASLCKSTLSLRMLPSAVLAKCGLPAQVTFSQKSLKELARYWVEHAEHFDADVLFTVVSKLKVEDKDTFFSSALVDIPSGRLEQHKALVSKIISTYSPYVKDSRFSKLSQVAQQVVRDLIGAMSFGDFSKLITKLTQPAVAEKLGLEEWEIRQLNSRVAFWSNYQSRFLGFSVFLPTSTYTLLKQLNFHTDDMLFHQLNNASCEVCVLEFEKHYVLEFLRGGSSGVRIIDKHSQTAQVLKSTNNVSSQQQLEAIPFLAEHDHLIYWQNACEKLLRTTFNLTPNERVKKFLITHKDKNGHPFYQDYSSTKGLPKLSAVQLLEREESLRNYRRKSSKFTQDKSEPIQDIFENLKDIIKFFSSEKTSGGWFGYSEKFGWLIEVGGSSSGLVLQRLDSGSTITVTNYELNGSLYIDVLNYLNGLHNVDDLRKAYFKLESVVDKIPITSIRNSLSNIIKKTKHGSSSQANSKVTQKKKIFSDEDLIALAASHGGAHLDNRHKGGTLKIALQKYNSELEKQLLLAGFKEIEDKPLVFWKK